MIQKLAVVPLGHQPDSTNYNGNTSPSGTENSVTRDFIDWKKALTMFTLIMSPMPDQEQLETYSQALL
jgi:hypothetical protein